MAATNFTPISLYYTTTAAAAPVAGNLVSGELAINITDGKLYYKNNSGVVTLLASTSGASGDVVGPASATDNALARFDLTTGKLIQNSVGILSDAGILTGLTGLTSSGSITLSSLTSGRVTYAGTAGLLQDSANLTFNGTTLTANTIGAYTLSGTIAGGGNQINNVIIGTSTPLAGSFTSVNATSITNSGLTSGRVTYAGASGLLSDSANFVFNGTNLGLGTPSPSAKFNVVGGNAIFDNTTLEVGFNSTGSNRYTLLYATNTGSTLYYGVNGTASGAQIDITGISDNASYFGSRSNTPLQFFTNNTVRTVITSAGNVGIGISNPAYSFDLSSTTNGVIARFKSTSTYGQVIADNSSGTGGGIFVCKQNGVTSSYFGVEGAIQGNTSTDTAIYNDIVGSSIKFFTNANVTPKVTIDSSGNLGLGVIPSAGQGRLQVAGSSTSWFKFYDSSAGSNYGTFYQSNGSSSLGYIGSGGGAALTGGASTDLVLRSEANLLFASGGNSERMRIDSSGNVGIGTSSPSSFGGFSATSIGGTNKGLLTLRNAGGSDAGFVYCNGTNFQIEALSGFPLNLQTASGQPHIFTNVGTERMRITSGGTVIIGNAVASTNVELYLNGVSGKAKRIQFNNSGVSSWLIGDSAASETNNAFEIYNANGQMALSFAKATSNATFYNSIGIGNTAPSASGSGIAFPATQSASSDANTLDDYEEGTWTPSQGAGLTVVGTFSSSGTYTKIGRVVTLRGSVSGSTTVSLAASDTVICGNIPFTPIGSVPDRNIGGMTNNTNSAFGAVSALGSFTTIYNIGTIAATTDIHFSVTYFA